MSQPSLNILLQAFTAFGIDFALKPAVLSTILVRLVLQQMTYKCPYGGVRRFPN